MLIHLDTGAVNIADPYNAFLQLSQRIDGCSKLILKGVEMPLVFPNVRSGGKLNSLSIQVSTGTIYEITIAEQFYDTIADVCTAMNISFQNVLPSNLSLVASVSDKNKVVLTMTDSNKIVNNLMVLPSTFSQYILGFKNVNAPSTNYNAGTGVCSLTARLVYNLQADTVLYLRLANIRTHTIHSTNSTLLASMHYKIPLNSSTNGLVYYMSDEVSYKQCIQIDPSDVYTSLNVQVYDRWGNLLQTTDGSVFDWSLTIEAM